jgi:hypothetical protein
VTRAAAVVAMIALLADCDGGAERGGIERAEFVATFVDLREATVRGTLDSASRDSILAAHGVTEAELRAYVEARSDDPDALAETWREVLDSVAARDSAAAPPDSNSAQPDTD